jgi:flagellar basal-body rod protein FlgB
MAMINETSAIALKVLDGLTLRGTAIAQNIANAASPGYRPVRVSFEDELRAAAARGAETVGAVAPRIEFAPPRPGSEIVRIDLEIATATATAGRYAAVVDVLGRQMQLASMAIRGSQA